MTPCKFNFSMSIRPDPSDEELLFVKQLGVTHVYSWVGGDQREFAFLANLRPEVEDAGLTLWMGV